jgi:hypothetical protein
LLRALPPRLIRRILVIPPTSVQSDAFGRRLRNHSAQREF